MVEATQADRALWDAILAATDAHGTVAGMDEAVPALIAVHRLAAEAGSDVLLEALQCIANPDWSVATVESMRALARVALARREHAGEG